MMPESDRPRASFAVQLRDSVTLIDEHQVLGVLELVAAPRPGRSFTVREGSHDLAAEVVYLAFPDAPAHEVSFHEIARSWAVLHEAGIAADLGKLTTAQAVQVVDLACSHLVGGGH